MLRHGKSTKDLVAGAGLAFSELGPRRLKGIEGTVRLFRATA
jgi:class 3 adenylate cyclase